MSVGTLFSQDFSVGYQSWGIDMMYSSFVSAARLSHFSAEECDDMKAEKFDILSFQKKYDFLAHEQHFASIPFIEAVKDRIWENFEDCSDEDGVFWNNHPDSESIEGDDAPDSPRLTHGSQPSVICNSNFRMYSSVEQAQFLKRLSPKLCDEFYKL